MKWSYLILVFMVVWAGLMPITACAQMSTSSVEAEIQKQINVFTDPHSSFQEISAAVDALVNIGTPAIPALIKLLTACNNDSAFAERTLREMGEPAIPALIQTVRQHSNRDTHSQPSTNRELVIHNDLVDCGSYQALQALAGIGAALPELAKLAEDPNPRKRVMGLLGLKRSGSLMPVHRQLVIRALQDKNGEVRCAAAQALPGFYSEKDSPELTAYLIAGLPDLASGSCCAYQFTYYCRPTKAAVEALRAEVRRPERKDRADFLWPLHDAGPEIEGVISALIEAVGDTDEDVAFVAARIMGFFGPPAASAVPALIAKFEEKHELIFADTLGKIGPAAGKAVIPLKKVLQDKDDEFLPQIALALYQIRPRDPTARNAIIKMTDSPNVTLRKRAVEALGGLNRKDRKILRILMRALQDSEAEVRWTAAYALGELKADPPMVVSALIMALPDPESAVRFHLLQALPDEPVADDRLIPALMKLLHDPDAEVRREAAANLGLQGPAALSAVPALLELVKNDNRDIRDEARIAIKRIDPETWEKIK